MMASFCASFLLRIKLLSYLSKMEKSSNGLGIRDLELSSCTDRFFSTPQCLNTGFTTSVFSLQWAEQKIIIIITKGREALRKKPTHKYNSLNANQLCGCL